MTKITKLDYRRRLELAKMRYAQSTPVNALPALPFWRLVKEITKEFKVDERWSKQAVKDLREVAQDYITDVFDAANEVAIHNGRTTITPKDMKLAVKLKLAYKPVKRAF